MGKIVSVADLDAAAPDATSELWVAFKAIREDLADHGGVDRTRIIQKYNGGGSEIDQLFEDLVDSAIVEEEGRRLPDPKKGNEKASAHGKNGGLEIDAGNQDLPAVTRAAWDAIVQANVPPRLFRFGGDPVRLEADDAGALFLRPLGPDHLRGEAARSAKWVRRAKENSFTYTKPALPPMPVVRDMLTQPDIPLPVLLGVIGVPAFGPDGRLHDIPGYNPETRTYYSPVSGFRVPRVSEYPSDAEIRIARATIVDDLLHDFPFTGAPERAHAVGLMLLPMARNLILGPTPLHLIEKPTPGTGASLLVDVLFIPSLGRSVSAMTEGGNEDEWRKRLLAILRGGSLVTLIDNLRGKLDSASVSSAITATVWEDRKLGTSDTIRVPVRCAWVATGNNPALSSEISRRTVRIRLDAKEDRPWQRTGFLHPDLRAWVAESRGDLVWSALTLIRGWLAAGRPVPPELPMLGMFENWATVIGGILAHAQIPGFLGNLADFYDASDSDGAETRAFLSAWWGRHLDTAVGVSALWEIASAPDSLLPLGDKGERSQRMRLGKLLARLRDRRYQLKEDLTVCIAAAGVVHQATQWRLRKA